jgi:hypothetical protein
MLVAVAFALGGLATARAEDQATAASDAEMRMTIVNAKIAAGLQSTATIQTIFGGLFGFLPRQLWVPNGYEIDLDRDPPRFAAPIDRDTLVGFDVPGGPSRRLRARLAWAEESRFIGETGNVVSFRIEWRW